MTTVDVAGDQLYYEEYLPTSEAVQPYPLVWLHGFSFNASLYKPVVELLPRYRHLVIDMRGHGKSAGADSDMTFERIVNDVHAIVTGLGIERFVIVGHSLGNAVGMRFAATYPDMIERGVAVAGVPTIGMPAAARAGLAAIADTAGDTNAFLSTFNAICKHPGQEKLMQAAAEAAAGMSADALRMAASEPMRDDSDVLVASVTCPWLFLVPGADDAVPTSLQRAGAELFVQSTIVELDGEGHALPQERPDLVAAHIDNFLADIAGTTDSPS